MYETIIVHSGNFHSDDALCVAMMKNINPDIKVIRTRNPFVLEAAKENSDTLVCDVGYGELDHHQDNVKTFKDGRKYGACRLLYEKLVNEKLFPENDFLDKLTTNISHTDNGQVSEGEERHLITKLCNSMNPFDGEQVEIDEVFNETVELLSDYVKSIIENNVDKIKLSENKIQEKYDSREVLHQEIKVKDAKEIREMMLEQDISKGYLIADRKLTLDTLCNSPIDFVIYSNDYQVQVRAVPTEPDGYTSKVPLDPKMEGFDFVHKAGFLGNIKIIDDDKDAAIKKACSLIEKVEEKEVKKRKAILK